MNEDQLNDQNLREQLIECGQLFHSRGWSVGTSSNYSAVRNDSPTEISITASGKDKGRLMPEDFVVVDHTGVPIAGESQKSSAETMLHVKAVELFGAKSVLHTHSVWGTLLSDFYGDEDGFEISGYEMLKGLEGIGTPRNIDLGSNLRKHAGYPNTGGRIRKIHCRPSRPKLLRLFNPTARFVYLGDGCFFSETPH